MDMKNYSTREGWDLVGRDGEGWGFVGALSVVKVMAMP